MPATPAAPQRRTRRLRSLTSNRSRPQMPKPQCLIAPPRLPTDNSCRSTTTVLRRCATFGREPEIVARCARCSGSTRPSSVTVAFQCWKLGSRSAMSWPRSATRTGWRRLRRDAVLVPRDVPGERQHHLGVDAGERGDRGLRLAECLGDAGDRAPELGRVEQLGSLDERDLVVAEPAQDRLADDRLRPPPRGLRGATATASAGGAGAAGCWSIGETETPSLTQPWSSGDVGAERADVDERACRRASSAGRARPAAAFARRRRRSASPWS